MPSTGGDLNTPRCCITQSLICFVYVNQTILLWTGGMLLLQSISKFREGLKALFWLLFFRFAAKRLMLFELSTYAKAFYCSWISRLWWGEPFQINLMQTRNLQSSFIHSGFVKTCIWHNTNGDILRNDLSPHNVNKRVVKIILTFFKMSSFVLSRR